MKLTILQVILSMFLLTSGYSNKNNDTILFRIQISTTSDWTILKLKSFPEIITMRVFAVEGENLDFKLFYDEIKLTQKLDLREKRSRIVVDVLLKAQDLYNMNFLLKKGSIGKSEVKFFVLKEDIFEDVFSKVHSKNIEDGSGENEIKFAFSFRFKQEYKFISEKRHLIEIPKLILAFYYLWYKKNNWFIFPLDDTPVSFYSSSDERVMLQHIRQAKSNGIDGFICSWDEPNSYSDSNIKKFLKLSDRNNFKVAFYLETLTENGPRTEIELYENLKYLITNYSSHKSVIKIFDKPLIFIWATNEIPIDTWRRIIRRLRSESLDATFIAMSYDLAALEVFDGLHQYGVILLDDLKREYEPVSKIVKNYYLLSGAQKIWTATVQPGYDERKIPKRKGFYKERNDGKYFQETFIRAIESNPDFILITSWNEWWEHTHIEPSKKHKNLYLSLTKKYAKKFKSVKIK